MCSDLVFSLPNIVNVDSAKQRQDRSVVFINKTLRQCRSMVFINKTLRQCMSLSTKHEDNLDM